MNLSREFVLANLKQVRKNLSDWIRELEKPTILEGGKEVEVYPDGNIPKGISVGSMEGIPAEQFKSELTADAGILLAMSSGE
jgi:hypothetical protein